MDKRICAQHIIKGLFDIGLIADFMNNRHEDWDSVINNAEYASVIYLRNFVNYQMKYMSVAVDEYVDLAMVIYHDLKPVAVWPFCLRRSNVSWVCGSNEGAVCPPLFVKSIGEKTRKSIIDKCFLLIENICSQTGQVSWQGIESIGATGVSNWYRKILDKDARVSISHELYVDLSLSIENIRKNIRKSYKSLLTAGNKLWNISIIDNDQPDIFTEFRQLHCRVAGRITRGIETWDLQQEAIAKKEAFLITLRDKEGILVGGGLFYISRDEGLYAVGAYDRNLFDKPLGHVVQMKAIEMMKELGIRWYKIGHRPYVSDANAPTEKEITIGKFKEGFATNIFFRLHTECPVK